MTPALHTTGGPAVARFSVDQIRVDGGQVVVQGAWSGVRGMRFLRPTLVIDGQQVLATLEHKPWAPDSDGPWIAAFPWSGGKAELSGAWMEVAPSVMVPLDPEAASGVPLRAPEPTSVVAGAVEPAPVAPSPPRSEPAPAAVPASSDAAGVSEDDDEQAELLRRRIRETQRREEDSERSSRIADADRDRALAMRDEAVRDREAAIRTRDRMSRALDEAEQAAQDAHRRSEQAVAAAERDRDERVAAAGRSRDEVVGERDALAERLQELRAQREDVLTAHRALEQTLRSERADRQRTPTAAPAAGSASPVGPGAPLKAEDELTELPVDDDAPLGVRAIPAVRSVGARALTPRPPGRADLAPFDRWALRVLATAAATCFVLLLLLLVRLFV